MQQSQNTGERPKTGTQAVLVAVVAVGRSAGSRQSAERGVEDDQRRGAAARDCRADVDHRLRSSHRGIVTAAEVGKVGDG